MEEKRKDYENQIEMARQFNEWYDGIIPKTPNDPALAINSQILLWQVRAELAMSQQLTMVSKHLNELVRLLETTGQSLANHPK